MNIVSLQTFIAIVETGSLVRASQRMNVTQSTVTARLKTLEQEIGQILLNRQKSGVTLTPAGTKLLSYARIMCGLWRQAKFETSLPAGLDTVCTFGCDRELWHGTGRQFCYDIFSNHPKLSCRCVRAGHKIWKTGSLKGRLMSSLPMKPSPEVIRQSTHYPPNVSFSIRTGKMRRLLVMLIIFLSITAVIIDGCMPNPITMRMWHGLVLIVHGWHSNSSLIIVVQHICLRRWRSDSCMMDGFFPSPMRLSIPERNA